jgi:hypothetical protein
MEHLFSRFLEQRPEIERLLARDEDLREMCEDYETLACLLARPDEQAVISAKLAREYRTLLEALAAEILEVLASAQTVINCQKEQHHGTGKN